MTAYLQPGDKIHIAFGVTQGTSEQVGQAAERGNAEFVEMYAAMGIQVIGSTACVGFTHPVVVSVVRDPLETPMLLPGDQS